MGACIGIACLRHHGYDSPGLIEVADATLYEPTRRGKNTFAVGLPPAQAAPRESPWPAVQTPRPIGSVSSHPSGRPARLF